MSKKKENEGINLTKNLQELSQIATWFDEQDELDVEEGLKKVKEAAKLITESKGRLQEVENEFEEVKKDVAGELNYQEESQTTAQDESTDF